MELSREEFQELLIEVLEIMMKSRDKEPCVNQAVDHMRDTHDISDSVANCLANEAYFQWPATSRGL